MFHAAQSSSWCGVSSVYQTADGWTVVKEYCFYASAIFIDDYLVYSEKESDRVQNYFGYVCQTTEDVRLELQGK
jgi:hypothetical protein